MGANRGDWGGSIVAKTAIFISSVAEDGLKPLRKEVFRELESLGHEPIMWEENLGPWLAHVNPVMKCLEAVDGSDIYLLFIGSKAGTYYPEAERTVTHLEFLKAHEAGKTTLVFADTEIKQQFFRFVKPLIDEHTEHFLSENDRYPSPLELMSMLKQFEQVPKHVDPYIWFMLHDMLLRKVYIDDVSLGVPIHWKGYFSDLLRRGSLLLPLEDSIEQTASRLDQLDDAYVVVTELIPYLQISGIQNKEQFLRSIMLKMSGGLIEKKYGPYMTEVIGSYGDCSAVTLYEHKGEQMVYSARTGAAFEVPAFELEDQSSYVVLTYQMGDKAEQVYFKESRHTFYYSIRSGRFVLTLHFPAPPDWDTLKFTHFKESVNHAIISKNPLMIEFIKLFMGGM